MFKSYIKWNYSIFQNICNMCAFVSMHTYSVSQKFQLFILELLLKLLTKSNFLTIESHTKNITNQLLKTQFQNLPNFGTPCMNTITRKETVKYDKRDKSFTRCIAHGRQELTLRTNIPTSSSLGWPTFSHRVLCYYLT